MELITTHADISDNHKDVITEKIKKFGLARMSNFVNENASLCPKEVPSASAYLSGQF